MKLLSICIPTYNRAHFLKEALYGLEKAIPENNKNLFEIVISNNCSTDQTHEVINDFIDKNPLLEINVIHQNVNIGPKNTAVVSSYAKGEFIWIISDDDVILQSSLKKILLILKKAEHINGIIINYAGFQSNSLMLEKPVLLKKNGILNKNMALEHLCTSITFISALVYRREKTHLSEKFLDNNLPHSFIFLQAIKDGKIYSCSEVLLAMRMGNSGGYDFYKVFLETFSEVLDYAKELDFNKLVVENVKRKHLRNHVTIFSIIFKSSRSYGELKISKSSAFNLLLNYNRRDFYTKILAFYVITPDFLSVPLNYLRLLRRKILNINK